MSRVPIATIPTADANQRKRKADQDNGDILVGSRISQSCQRRIEAGVEGGGTFVQAGAPFDVLPSVAGGSQDTADRDAALASLLPEEIQLWKAACLFAREPSLEELITIIKVSSMSRCPLRFGPGPPHLPLPDNDHDCAQT